MNHLLIKILLIGVHHFGFLLANTKQSVDCIVQAVHAVAKRKIALEYTKENQEFVSDILQNVNVPVVLNIVEHRKKTEIERRISIDVLLLLKDEEPLKILNNKIWNGDTRFLIITRDEETVEEYFEQFWKLNVINVFGMVLSDGNNTLYSFLPYGKKNCTKAELIIVDSCMEGQLQNGGTALKDPMRIKDMNQCPLSITISPIKPALIVDPKESLKNITTVTGYEGNFITEVSKVYNCKAAFKTSEDGFGWGWILPSPRGAIGDLYRGVTDITMGMQAALMQRFIYLDIATSFYSDECVTFAVPQGYGAKNAQWLTNLVTEFTYSTWTLIILSFIATAFNVWIIYRYLEVNWFTNNMDVFLLLYSSYLGFPLKIPHYMASKTTIIFWIVFSFVLTVAYKASMGSILTVPPRDPDIKDYKELLDSDLVPTGLKNQIQILGITNEWPFSEFINRFQISNDGVGKMVSRLANREKIASFYPKSTFYYHSLVNPKARGKIHVLKDCVYPYQPCAMLRKFSPFTRRVSQTVRRLEESGIMEMWRSQYSKLIPPPKKPFFKLSMDQMFGIFCFLLVGYGVALVSFLYEVYCIVGIRYPLSFLLPLKFNNGQVVVIKGVNQ